MDKLKVLLVDDEILVRIGLKSIVDWDSLGCELMGEAADGLEALEICRNTRPDILFTDIIMPGLGGLELIQQVKEEYKEEIFFVILTSYDEFDYAKQAIKLGIEDYLLKLALNKDVLAGIVERIRAKAVQGKKAQQLAVSLENQYKNNFELIRNNFIKNLLHGNGMATEEILTVLEKISLKFGFEDVRFQVMAFSIDQFEKRIREGYIKDRVKYVNDFKTLSNNILKQFEIEELFTVEENLFIVLLDMKAREEDFLKALFDRMKYALMNYMNISVSGGASAMGNNIKELQGKIKEAVEALGYRFYGGKGSLSAYGSYRYTADGEVLMTLAEEQKLYQELILQHGAEAAAIIQDLLLRVKASSQYTPLKVLSIINEIVFIFSRTAKTLGGALEEMEAGERVLPFMHVQELENMDDMVIWLKEYSEALLRYLSAKRNAASRREIAKIKDYIEQNYMEEITLDFAAKYVSMSRNYFSSLFKKETGENFVDYILRVKVEKAFELIVKNRMKVYEAAEKVGFRNINYFSKVFKKIKGISPSTLK